LDVEIECKYAELLNVNDIPLEIKEMPPPKKRQRKNAKGYSIK